MYRTTLLLTLVACSAGAAPRKAARKTPAKASATPALAVHPVVLERASRRGNEELLTLFEKAVAAEAEVAPSEAVQAFLEKQSGGTCANRNPCLAALAKAVGARYTLYATIAPNGPKLQLEARLVRADGKVVKEVNKLSAEKPAEWTREAAVEEGYRLLLAKLKLTAVPGLKKPRPPEPEPAEVAPPPQEVAAVPEPVKEPVKEPVREPVREPVPVKEPVKAPTIAARPPVLPPEALPSVAKARPPAPGSALRTTGWVLAGTGVALGGGAAVLAFLADKDAKALTPNANGAVPAGQVETALAMRTKASAALGLGAGAGVGLAVGITFIALSSSDTALAVVPGPGGATLVFSGTLP